MSGRWCSHCGKFGGLKEIHGGTRRVEAGATEEVAHAATGNRWPTRAILRLLLLLSCVYNACSGFEARNRKRERGKEIDGNIVSA